MTSDLKQDGPPNSSADAGFHFWRAFARHWRESVRYCGWWRFLRELSYAVWSALLELLPSRRKARFGDLDYDWEYSVDTTRSNVGVGTQFLTGLMARPYFATEPWLFAQMMEALELSIQQSAVGIQQLAVSQGHLVPSALQDFTFVDLGSGKGRALLMAAKYGFKNIIGVEFMPEWHRVAQENIRKYTEHHTESPLDHLCGTGTPACAAEMARGEGIDASVSIGVCATKAASIKSLCMDARDFEFPATSVVVYLFNPFSEATFVAVLENLRKSIEQAPRPVYIAYRFTEFGGLLTQAVWLEKVAGEEQWAVYRNRENRRHRS